MKAINISELCALLPAYGMCERSEQKEINKMISEAILKHSLTNEEISLILSAHPEKADLFEEVSEDELNRKSFDSVKLFMSNPLITPQDKSLLAAYLVRARYGRGDKYDKSFNRKYTPELMLQITSSGISEKVVDILFTDEDKEENVLKLRELTTNADQQGLGEIIVGLYNKEHIMYKCCKVQSTRIALAQVLSKLSEFVAAPSFDSKDPAKPKDYDYRRFIPSCFFEVVKKMKEESRNDDFNYNELVEKLKVSYVNEVYNIGRLPEGCDFDYLMTRGIEAMEKSTTRGFDSFIFKDCPGIVDAKKAKLFIELYTQFGNDKEGMKAILRFMSFAAQRSSDTDTMAITFVSAMERCQEAYKTSWTEFMSIFNFGSWYHNLVKPERKSAINMARLYAHPLVRKSLVKMIDRLTEVDEKDIINICNIHSILNEEEIKTVANRLENVGFKEVYTINSLYKTIKKYGSSVEKYPQDIQDKLEMLKKLEDFLK